MTNPLLPNGCSRTWAELEMIPGSPTMRHCKDCRSIVHWAETASELLALGEQGLCGALASPFADDGMFVGLAAPPVFPMGIGLLVHVHVGEETLRKLLDHSITTIEELLVETEQTLRERLKLSTEQVLEITNSLLKMGFSLKTGNSKPYQSPDAPI